MSSTGVFFQLLINGMLLGSMYGVAAIGLSLIFGSMEIIFIAQGAVMILAAYCTYFLFHLGRLDPFASLGLVLPGFLALGFCLYHLLFRRVAGAGKNAPLLIAFGLMILLENLMSVLWTPDTRALQTSYAGLGLSLGTLQISFTRLMVFVLSLAATLAVAFWLRLTLTGKAVRAATEDQEAATLMGISPHKVKAITFGIGIALAGLAGTATASCYSFDPTFGFLFSLKALIAVALGGIGSVAGAMFGGVFLGVLESAGSYLFTGVWANAVSYTAFLVVLMVRPEGLFTRTSRRA
ncbi:MAG: branched-chain amino acid ABC transporter permease [Thermodesulfobacteriota bacterium]